MPYMMFYIICDITHLYDDLHVLCLSVLYDVLHHISCVMSYFSLCHVSYLYGSVEPFKLEDEAFGEDGFVDITKFHTSSTNR